MTLPEFNQAIEQAYQAAHKRYNADIAGSACMSALTLGHQAFEDANKVMTYVLNSAKGDKWARKRDKFNQRKRLAQLYQSMPERYVDPSDNDFQIDLEKALVNYDEDMRHAITAYLLHGETVDGAIWHIQSSTSRITKYIWLTETIKGLFERELREYAP